MGAQVWLQGAAVWLFRAQDRLSCLKPALWDPKNPLKELRKAASGYEWFEKEPGAQDRLFGVKDRL